MYVAVDIGGSKTLVAVLNHTGEIQERSKFATPHSYVDFLDQLQNTLAAFDRRDYQAGAAGVPGLLDRQAGVAISFGNLPWKNVPIQTDLEKLCRCPILIDNDANLAGLSEAMLLPEASRVLYITISTGIGTGIIADRRIDPAMQDSEGGSMILDFHGRPTQWQRFASGKSIVERFHKQAEEIEDTATWKIIAHDLARGFIQLMAMVQPDVIVLGGSVGSFLPKYKEYIIDELKKFDTPMVPLPKIKKAQRPREAVIYGCFDLASSTYGPHR